MMEQMSLFDTEVSQPLASRLRPRTLEEFAGQTHLIGPGKGLRRRLPRRSDPIRRGSFPFRRGDPAAQPCVAM